MNTKNDVLGCATRLEGILRKYLNCGYNDFGVKANDNLASVDWKSPINFALGCRYGEQKFNESSKEIIAYFLGNELKGQNIGDLISNYEYYSFDTVDDAYSYVNETIKNLEKILID